MSTFDFCRHILVDIQDHLGSPDQYHLAKVAGLVRQLLFDERVVLLVAQKESGRRLVFTLSSKGFQYDSAQVTRHLVMHMADDLEPTTDVVEVTPDKYGTLKVLTSQQQWFSIKGLIKYVANKRGGIHLDPDRLTSDQAIVEAVSRAVDLGGVESVFPQVGYIGRNVLGSARRCGWLGY